MCLFLTNNIIDYLSVVLIKSTSVKAARFPVPSDDFCPPDPVEAQVSGPWCVVELEFQSRHLQEMSQVPMTL